ncbi:MAG: hypothetical protein GPOALKHO_000593 [Sodalis sp.]|nr:MAG: hypothetical protein GPOALKHO_000593 [Sodalis sp.]
MKARATHQKSARGSEESGSIGRHPAGYQKPRNPHHAACKRRRRFTARGPSLYLITDQSVVGHSECVAVTYPRFTQDLAVDNAVLMDDGLLGMAVPIITIGCAADEKSTWVSGSLTGVPRRAQTLPSRTSALPARVT